MVIEFGKATGREVAYRFNVLKPNERCGWMNFQILLGSYSYMSLWLKPFKSHCWEEPHPETAYEAVSADCPFPLSVLSDQH